LNAGFAFEGYLIGKNKKMYLVFSNETAHKGAAQEFFLHKCLT
jgi:hypothetical protein